MKTLKQHLLGAACATLLGLAALAPAQAEISAVPSFSNLVVAPGQTVNLTLTVSFLDAIVLAGGSFSLDLLPTGVVLNSISSDFDETINAMCSNPGAFCGFSGGPGIEGVGAQLSFAAPLPISAGSTAMVSMNFTAPIAAGDYTMTGLVTTTDIELNELTALYSFTITTAVPEPASYALMLGGLGLVGLAAARRRRQAR